jgi:hypothetical protein
MSKLHSLRLAFTLLACIALAACSAGGQTIPKTLSDTGLHPQGVQPPADGGGNDGGGSPQATPNPGPSEKGCTSAGGTFFNDIGGNGLVCAGAPGGPPAITSYKAKCNYTISITRGHGQIARGGTLLGEFQLGVEVFDDCSYNMMS